MDGHDAVCFHAGHTGRPWSFLTRWAFRLHTSKRIEPHHRNSMIAHLREREKTLNRSGGAGKDAEWVAMVCLHSGVFTRLQYMDYFNTYHNRASRFVQSLLDLRLAVDEEIPVISTKNRTEPVGSPTRGIYRELGIPNVRHRRIADPAVYLRRLLSARLRDRPPQARMAPHRNREGLVLQTSRHQEGPPAETALYGAAGYLTRYFPLKLPIAAGGPSLLSMSILGTTPSRN